LRLIWIVGAIRPMHREQPLSAGTKFKGVERVGETIRPPPSGKARRIPEGLKYGLWLGWNFSRMTKGGHAGWIFMPEEQQSGQRPKVKPANSTAQIRKKLGNVEVPDCAMLPR